MTFLGIKEIDQDRVVNFCLVILLQFSQQFWP